ncbi:MAG: hypothetical protein H0X51_05920 [Parachlamydiaceae bacterium]|nr:hypothetical protein [Parachlamydiaceae bacterium]
MKRVFSLLLLLVALCGCGPRYVDFFPCHDDGTYKPHVAFMSVLDSSCLELPWKCAPEITSDIRYELMNNGQLFLYEADEVDTALKSIDKAQLFDSDAKIAKACRNTDFFVVMEIIEQELQPYESVISSPYAMPNYPNQSVLTVKVRIKVLDVRAGSPRIILQEIVTKTYMVPRVCTEQTIRWADENAHWVNCIRKAHRQTAMSISRRLEDVIRSAY